MGTLGGETGGGNSGVGKTPCESSSTSTSLLQRVKAREPDGWRRLVDLYGPLVYEWCRRTGVRSEDAADVFQEVFTSVFTHIGSFRRDCPGQSFRAWLWRITRNKVHDHFRKLRFEAVACGGTDAQAKLAEAPDPPPGCMPIEQPDDDNRIEFRALELIQATVEERSWRAFWALVVEDRKATDVAQELEMNHRAVFEAKYRVLRRLRQELRDLTE